MRESVVAVQLKWLIGPIQCQCVRTRVWGQDLVEMRVFGYYWNLNGVKKRCFLDYTLERAIANCYTARNGLWFETNAEPLLVLLTEDR